MDIEYTGSTWQSVETVNKVPFPACHLEGEDAHTSTFFSKDLDLEIILSCLNLCSQLSSDPANPPTSLPSMKVIIIAYYYKYLHNKLEKLGQCMY